MFIPTLVSISAYLFLIKEEVKKTRSIKKLLFQNNFSEIILSIPIIILILSLDMQGYPDLYIILPFLTILSSWIIINLTNYTDTHKYKKKINKLIISFSLILILSAFLNLFLNQNTEFSKQYFEAQYIKDNIIKNKKYISIGNPQYLSILEEKNSSKFVFIINGIDSYINENYDGGIDKWLDDQLNNEFIIFGKTNGKFEKKIIAWLNTNYEQIHTEIFKIYKKKTAQ